MKSALSLALLVVAMSVTVSAAGAIVPLEQARSVSATAQMQRRAETSNDSHGFPAPDFLPFNQTANAMANVTGGSANAMGSQNSQISDTLISATGEAKSGGVVLPAGDAASGFGSAKSEFMLKFAMDAPATVDLSGSVGTELGGGGVSAKVVLSDSSGTLVSVTNPPAHQPFSYMLDLDAGEYTLMANALALSASGAPGGFSGQSDFAFSFQVIPEPGVLSMIGLGLASAMVRTSRRRRWGCGG